MESRYWMKMKLALYILTQIRMSMSHLRYDGHDMSSHLLILAGAFQESFFVE